MLELIAYIRRALQAANYHQSKVELTRNTISGAEIYLVFNDKKYHIDIKEVKNETK